MIEFLTSPTVVLTILGLLSSFFGWLIKRFVKRQWALDFLRRFGALVEIAVVEVSTEYTENIKRGRADGKLTKEEVEEAERRALKRLHEHLSLDNFARALGVLGMPGSPEQHAKLEIAKVHAGLQSLGIVPKGPTRAQASTSSSPSA